MEAPRRQLNMSYSKTASQPGFTLVEMLVVAPIVILVVGGIVALLIALVGDVLIARERNSMAYNTQDALNLIEQDVRLSSNIQATTGTLPSPQGSDSNVSGTAAFQSNSALILTLYATNLSPTDPNRLIITLNTPSACGSPNATANTPFTYTVVYFVYNNSLWRRVIVPDYNTNSSNTTVSYTHLDVYKRQALKENYSTVFASTTKTHLFSSTNPRRVLRTSPAHATKLPEKFVIPFVFLSSKNLSKSSHACVHRSNHLC